LKTYSDEFKRKIIFEIVENKKTPLQVFYEYNIPIELIEKWQQEFSEQNNKKSDSKLFNNYKKTIFILSFLLFCIGICFLTGCFASKSTSSVQLPLQVKKEDFKYKNFVTSWNKIILGNQYFATFKTNYLLLPTSSNKALIEKLNQIFNTKRIESQINLYEKMLTRNNLIDIPVTEYIKFLKNLNLKNNRFNEKMSINEITKTILFMMNYEKSYLNFKVLQKLTWTYSFKKYFKDNIKNFIKKGFSRNLLNYEKYLKIIKKP